MCQQPSQAGPSVHMFLFAVKPKHLKIRDGIMPYEYSEIPVCPFKRSPPLSLFLPLSLSPPQDEPRVSTTPRADWLATPTKKPTLGKSTSLPAYTRYRCTPPPTPPSASSPYNPRSEGSAEMASPSSRRNGKNNIPRKPEH